MDRTTLPHSNISGIIRLLEQGKILLNPPYQRQLVWGDTERALLIDSISKDFDIGKFFFREVRGEQHDYEVIDGQQRLDTLRKFMNGKLAFPLESGNDLAGRTLPQLESQRQIELGGYILDVVVVKNAEETEVREMFRRLQLGKPLFSGERLKASYGKLHDFIEERVLKHKLFDGMLGFKDKRDVYFEVASQFVSLSLNGGPCDVEYKSLEKMYYDNQITLDDAKSKQFLRDLDFYREVLEGDRATFHPEKANSVSLFLFISKLKRSYVVNAETVIKFIKSLEAARHPIIPLTDSQLQEYNKKLSGGTGKKRSIEFRFNTLMKRFLASYPDTRLRDDKRVLTGEQRLAVYWRDDGQCKICQCQVSDKEFEIHHVDAWHKGGLTTVGNSLTVCKSCHEKITAGQIEIGVT